ncbi:hypothetical protein [Paraburkholderia adhaesiva]|uniref:hypothetical protein n=1 Tax=Paraburkholderia adhaesiva TaxID=2883244 RepID=UPI001F2726A7|nr:hypothetical protein [Paraburkholderia adhaesiva]
MGYSFLQTTGDPESVILETRPLLDDLFTRYPDLQENYDEFIGRIIDCFAYEASARDRLSGMCAQMVRDALQFIPRDVEAGATTALNCDKDAECRARIEAVTRRANEMYRVGMRLYELVCALGLYRDGYLHYQFADLLGHAVILQRLMAPLLVLRGPVDYLTDEELWAWSDTIRRRHRSPSCNGNNPTHSFRRG